MLTPICTPPVQATQVLQVTSMASQICPACHKGYAQMTGALPVLHQAICDAFRNHEEEQESDGTLFKAVQARWPVSHLPSHEHMLFRLLCINLHCDPSWATMS